MATVHSLVCFGGRTGKTVTFTDAGDVVNLTNHGLRPGSGVVFSNSGGALPTGITAGTTYYAKQGADNNKFLLYPTSADAIAGTSQVTFSGTGSGTHTVKSAWMLGLSDLSRYGTSGSERIYDGLVSWNSGRSGASAFDVEVCEIGEAFTDIIGTATTINIPSAQNRIETKIDGVRSDAFHGGTVAPATLDLFVLADGYVIYNTAVASASLLKIERYRDTIDGVSIVSRASGGVTLLDIGVQCRSYNNIIQCTHGTKYGTGLNMRSSLGEAVNNVISGVGTGLTLSGVPGYFVVGNLITKCTNGFSSGTTVKGFFYNNIVIGNTTTNWAAQPTALEGASNNVGATGNTIWLTAGGSKIEIAESSPFTALFADWTNNNFSPTDASSALVEAGISPYGNLDTDITGGVRIAYMGIGGSPVIDIGPYEFDHGYGPWPANHVLTLTNVAVGSRVFIRDQADTTTHFDQIAAGSTVVATATVHGDSRDNWRIRIRKASASPYYQPYETLMTATAGSSSIYVSQISDD